MPVDSDDLKDREGRTRRRETDADKLGKKNEQLRKLHTKYCELEAQMEAIVSVKTKELTNDKLELEKKISVLEE